MKVSIVIPAYNEEAAISHAIQAVLAQKYHNFEVIVVNNASTDRTEEIVRRYPPVKLVYESRKGLLAARERGRLESSGDLIANIDADCLPDCDWIARGIRHFSDPTVVAVTGPYDYHDGHPIFRAGSLHTQRHVYHLMSKLLQSRPIRRGAVLIGGNNIIRAAVLEKMGGYTTSITFYGEDTNTAKHVAAHGRVVFDKNFLIKTSARRFKAEGTIRLMLRYWYHFFRQIFSSKDK